jgi:hypothetical protein
VARQVPCGVLCPRVSLSPTSESPLASHSGSYPGLWPLKLASEVRRVFRGRAGGGHVGVTVAVELYSLDTDFGKHRSFLLTGTTGTVVTDTK